VTTRIGLLAAVGVVLLGSPASAQYAVSWWTVDGGGAMNVTAGPYTLGGTLGQPDAHPYFTGGTFAVAGGFWPGSSVGVETDLSVSQADSPDPVTGLQPLTYVITVTNLGPLGATLVSVSDTLPGGVTFQSAGGTGWTCSESGGVVNCARGTLAVGAAPALSIVVVAPGAATTLDNAVSVSAAEADPFPLNNTDIESTTVNDPPVTLTADLSIVKSDADVTAVPGEPLTYSVTVSNLGPHAVVGATVQDNFPPPLAGVVWTCSASPGSTCPGSGSVNIDDPVDLLSGGSAVFTATGTLAWGTLGPLSNTATVTAPGDVLDPNLSNNTFTEATPVADLIFRDGFEP
jgi:uncharacterized repeat protein (TIGR01451 family)